ncbi:MAG: DinB family protein [Acidobacteriota bacterium]
MLDVIRSLFGHMAWADHAVWRVVQGCEGARSSEEIVERFYHLHVVQHAFWMIWQRRRVEVPRQEEMATFEALRPFAAVTHRRIAAYLADASPESLTETLEIPWFRDPPLRVSTGDAMLQVASHSTHHRGQLASRLRALGVEPPTVDYIVWLWKGRPAPDWE